MGGHYLVIVVNLPLIEGRRAKFMVRRSFNPPPPPPSTSRTLTFFPLLPCLLFLVLPPSVCVSLPCVSVCLRVCVCVCLFCRPKTDSHMHTHGLTPESVISPPEYKR